MILSEYGEVIDNEINKITEYHQRLIVHDWVAMPDHLYILLSPGDRELEREVKHNT